MIFLIQFFVAPKPVTLTLKIMLGIIASLASFSCYSSTREFFSLEDLVTHVRLENRELRSARLNIEIKEAAVGPGSAWDDPVLALEFMNYPEDTLSSREMAMTGKQISLSQKIPFFGKTDLLAKSIEHEVEAARAYASDKEREILKDLRQHYFELTFLYQKQDLLSEQVQLLSQITTVARRQYETGKISQAELLLAQLDRAKIESELLRVKSQIENIEAEFVNHTGGRDFFKGKRPRPLPLTASRLNTKELSKERIQKLLVENNFKLKGQQNEIHARQAERAYFNKSNYPDFEVMGGYTLRDPSMNDRGVNLVSFRIGINLPIWSSHKQSDQIKGALSRESQASTDYEKNLLELLKQVEQIKTELVEYWARIELYEKDILELAKMTANSNRLNYLGSKVSFSNYLQSLRAQKDAQIEYYETKFAYARKMAELEFIVGELP